MKLGQGHLNSKAN